jgi:hypothetical protein
MKIDADAAPKRVKSLRWLETIKSINEIVRMSDWFQPNRTERTERTEIRDG